MSYKIMIIDDELDNEMKNGRKEKYQVFFEKKIEGIDVIFELIYVEYSRELESKIKDNLNQIDAFFIDARLSNNDKGWGGEWGINFNSVLTRIESIYGNSEIPPIFIVSKHWSDSGFLSNISKAFAVFHNPLQPSRFYSIEELDNCIKSATTKNKRGQFEIEGIKDEREYIEAEIKKFRRKKYNALVPIDVVIMVAVHDEKQKLYQYLDLDMRNDERFKEYGFSYQHTLYKNLNIIVVSQTTMGMTDAARVATASILAFKPKIIAMTGICAGRQDKTKLCDIVIAKEVFDYSVGKLNEEFMEHRPQHRVLKTGIDDFVKNCIVSNSEQIYADINRRYNGDAPDCKNNVHLGVMASGPWVVNDPQVFNEITSRITGECIALDMEAYALALAADQLDTPWIVVKSVQDYANGNKNKDESVSRSYAAYSSTYVLCENIEKIFKYIK